jgi:hypothetical protein
MPSPAAAARCLFCAGFMALVSFACRAPAPSSRVAGESAAACEDRKRAFVELVRKLPERSLNASIRADLPETTLGAVPGNAPVIEISEPRVVVDDVPVAAAGLAERLQAVRAWGAAHVPQAGSKPVVYLAAARDTDVETLRAYLAALPETLEPRLLVGTVALSSSAGGEGAAAESPATRLLAERDPAARRAIAEEGYRESSSCPEFARAVESSALSEPKRRWPALRAALLDAVPKCRCGDLDTVQLERLLSAEQRAGASTLGLLPLGFLRDVRCGASMPLRSIGKLVLQMERFDREFAGQFGKDAVEFNDVLAHERLLGYFCEALPGETLAAEQRKRATLYLRRGGEACEGWRFEPLSPGAPMGTFRRLSGGPPLSVHYWQAAEEIKLFGPVPEPATKPTDQHDWACQTTQRLISVDARSVQLESGFWFFDEAACRNATPDRARPLTGCFATLGEPLPAADAQPPAVGAKASAPRAQ